jgi:hypothetical protein
MGGTGTLLAGDGGGGAGAPKANVRGLYVQCTRTLCKGGIFKEMESPTDLNLERGGGGGDELNVGLTHGYYG